MQKKDLKSYSISEHFHVISSFKHSNVAFSTHFKLFKYSEILNRMAPISPKSSRPRHAPFDLSSWSRFKVHDTRSHSGIASNGKLSGSYSRPAHSPLRGPKYTPPHSPHSSGHSPVNASSRIQRATLPTPSFTRRGSLIRPKRDRQPSYDRVTRY